ncbi:hypothetical protein PLESTB_000108500 [Pleodorina starrii]|uniref:Uncharacterized protein n=1 Tax=Pleodorina starrii TaxID=330485 RepID=A0A9W6BB41_9CHLO|nr:hypothetical protein PLESTB_000108500 [Pleodorina starrii]
MAWQACKRPGWWQDDWMAGAENPERPQEPRLSPFYPVQPRMRSTPSTALSSDHDTVSSPLSNLEIADRRGHYRYGSRAAAGAAAAPVN